MSPNVVFVDTETTGLDPNTHNVWEIALVGDFGSRLYVRNADLIDLESADPTALRINGFYERAIIPGDTAGRKLPDDRAMALEVARLTAGRHLAGLVPGFDATFLAKWLLERGLSPAWHYQTIDVEVMAAGVLGLEPPYDTEQVVRLLNHPALTALAGEGKHTAMGDARFAAGMYNAALLRSHPDRVPA